MSVPAALFTNNDITRYKEILGVENVLFQVLNNYLIFYGKVLKIVAEVKSIQYVV